MNAPPAQKMDANGVDLTRLDGVFVRQQTQMADVGYLVFGVPYVTANKYQVFSLPPVAHEWVPTAQEVAGFEEIMFIHEESDTSDRVGWAFLGAASLRPLQYHFGSTSTGQMFTAVKSFKIGGWCGCPWEMDVLSGPPGDQILKGQVVQNFTPYCSRCFDAFCLATTFIDGVPASSFPGKDARFTVRTSLSCCGRVNNCCAPTCCRPKAIFDILDNSGKLVGVVQKHFVAGEGGEACCRMCLGVVNFSLKFPPQSSGEERALLLSAIMLNESYQPTA